MKSGPITSYQMSPDHTYFEPRVLSLFEHLFEFFGTLDSRGRVLELTGKVFDLTMIDPKTLSGQSFADTVFWQSRENAPDELRQAIERAAAGERLNFPLEFRINTDEKIDIEVTLVPQSVEHGETRIFIGALRIHPFSSADKNPTEMLSAADNAEIGLWIWEFDEDKIYATPRCNELLNIPMGLPLSYGTFLNAVHPEDRQAVVNFIKQSRDDGALYHKEFRVVYPETSVEWISAEGRFYVSEDGAPLRHMGVLRRVTREKAAAHELAQLYERETRARNEAVEANRAKDFFLAFVSHELRSPLNAILGWSKILLTKQVDEETRTNALQTIEKSARFQTKLIDDLVDSARVASGKLKLEYHPANLYEIVNASFQAQTPAAASHNIEFLLASDSDHIPIFGDAGRLQQVFGNLLSNAIKFTPDGGRVSIDIKTNPDNADVTVSDTGQGIEKDALPNIFRQFSQGDLSQVRRNYGLGLGLSIVNILVAKHGGTVEAASAGPGTGSRFTVTIPLSLTQVTGEPVIESQTIDPRPLSGIRILMVEDDADSREVLQLFLEQSGATVQSTDSARSAMKMLAASASENTLPDILISDLAMPEEDGYALIAKIRALTPELGGKIPALALSAFATSESKKLAFETGFTRYSTKPFEPDALIDEILDITGHRPKITD